LVSGSFVSNPSTIVPIAEGGESVEFHVAISVAAADKIVADAGRIDKGSRRKLQRVGQVASRIRQVLQIAPHEASRFH